MNIRKYFAVPFFIFLTLPFFSDSLFAKEIVLLNKTQPGTGATEEEAVKVFDAFVHAMTKIEDVDVRTNSRCEEPCEAPAIIISSELRVEKPFITLYFRIIDRKKGLAANVRRLRLKDAEFQDIIDILTPEYIKNFFDFLDRGAYSGTKVIEK
jgi:hypothetical protein